MYQGKVVEKPFIGKNDRVIKSGEITSAANINHRTCVLTVLMILLLISSGLCLP
ncbi:hypothetical protein D3C87_2061180 [compost metagenome]